MSYNYDECVQLIQRHRRTAYASPAAADLDALQQSMDGFASLSKNCPMTPLLWMQYAQDTKALIEGLWLMEQSVSGNVAQQQHIVDQAKKEAYESSAGILELALIEFPGCAILHLYNLENMIAYICECGEFERSNKISEAFLIAWESVGRGAHVNEGFIVADMFRLFASFLLLRLSVVAKQDHSTSMLILDELCRLLEQWSQTPMGEGSNNEMMQDMELLWEESSSIILSCFTEANEGEKISIAQQLQGRKSTLWASIDSNRRMTSSLTNILSSCENEIDIAMSSEGINLPWLSIFQDQQGQGMPDTTTVSSYLMCLKRRNANWDRIVLEESDGAKRFLLGFGGAETSRSFQKSISFIKGNYQDATLETTKVGNSNVNSSSPFRDLVTSHGYSIIVSFYERAISECPTVEMLWTDYIEFLSQEHLSTRDKLRKEKQNYQVLQQKQSRVQHDLLSASRRSIRNCPYSCVLFENRMTTIGLVSINLEPDDINAVIKEAIELGFLTANKEAMLQLRLTAIDVVKRRLLSLISLKSAGKDFDEDEAINIVTSKKQKVPRGSAVIYHQLDPSSIEEVKDLIEDMRDMYDEAENYLFKSHSSWVEGKARYWKHRATTEAYVICPIAKNDTNDDMLDVDTSELQDKEAIRCFEKLVKTEKPGNPESWREYIKYVCSSHMHSCGSDFILSQSQPDGFAAVPSTIRKTRGLYNRALSSVRKAGQSENKAVSYQIEPVMQSSIFQRTHDDSLLELCRDFLRFERNFGSDESFSLAQASVQSKMAHWTTSTVQEIVSANLQSVEHPGKRKALDNDVHSVDAMSEDDDNETQRCKKTKVQTNLKQPKKTDGLHKVKIGKLEYPAHPYTIHVSNLSKETQDMDIVDIFRKEVGNIVHAKILREKKFGKGHNAHAESKCAGLVQFEERISVEKALLQDAITDVGGNVIRIQRSHLPAVNIVPQGMHRVKPKGEGKSSKRNQLKKNSKMQIDTNESEVDRGNRGGGGKSSKANGGSGHVDTPSSISLSVLSFKPRTMKRKPILDTKK